MWSSNPAREITVTLLAKDFPFLLSGTMNMSWSKAKANENVTKGA